MKKITLPLILLALGTSALFIGKSIYSTRTWDTPKKAYQSYLYKRGLVNLLNFGEIIPAKSAQNVECAVLENSADPTISSVSEFKNKTKHNKVKSIYLASKKSKDTLFISQHLEKGDVELSKKCYQVVLNLKKRLTHIQYH